jgi:hypothetical protein
MCWKALSPLESKNMGCFLSTDTELSNERILFPYSQCSSIETYFKQMKTHLGFNCYQVRSEQEIECFWLLAQFMYLFAMELKQTTFTEKFEH